MQHHNPRQKQNMLSKALLKLIKSLEQRKYRKESGLFVAEGGKTVTDLLALHLEPYRIIATEEWLADNSIAEEAEVTVVTDEEMKRASFLRTPQGVLGIFRQPEHAMDPTAPQRGLCLALDNVQDPGNLGTIIRIADWFGIEDIFCSVGSADAYNPKTIQATMGAIGRVRVHYTSLPELIAAQKGKVPVYGTFLDGEDIYTSELGNRGIVIMGNEGNGISKECAALVDSKLLIPNFPAGRSTSESLNVSVATAIICSEFRRRM